MDPRAPLYRCCELPEVGFECFWCSNLPPPPPLPPPQLPSTSEDPVRRSKKPKKKKKKKDDAGEIAAVGVLPADAASTALPAICGTRVATFDDLIEHFSTCHDALLIEGHDYCAICACIFTSKALAMQHWVTKHIYPLNAQELSLTRHFVYEDEGLHQLREDQSIHGECMLRLHRLNQALIQHYSFSQQGAAL